MQGDDCYKSTDLGKGNPDAGIGVGVVILNKNVRIDLTEKVPFEQLLEGMKN